MNICVAILLAAALLGVADKAAGGRLGLAEGFDRGVQQMGSLCVSMTGFYCAATALCGYVMQTGTVSGGEGWFDPSLPVCMALAVDMGGWNAALQMASSPELAAFTGLLVASSADRNYSYIPDCSDLPIPENADYVYICENETIHGTTYPTLPNTKGHILVSDQSSMFLSKPCNVSDYGLIYAGVQKNVGPAGMVVV